MKTVLMQHRQKLQLSFTVLGLAIFFRIPVVPALTPQEIASIALESTVLIVMTDTRGDSYLGSGFVVGEEQIATNYHVIENIVSGTVELVRETTEYAIMGVLAADPPRDLAIIKVPGILAPALTLGDSDAVQIGQDVYAVGNPRGLKGTFSPGIISAIRPEGNSLVAGKLLQMTAPISRGSSGGPVLDRNADVIGLAVGQTVNGQNLNYAIPVNYLKALLIRTVNVNIPDSNLRAAIKSALGKASGSAITVGDMATLTGLEATGANISDLTGLEYATNLTSLDLSSNIISDISPIAELTNLTSLDLWQNTISDISPVAGLTNMKTLDLGNNIISDISPVVGLTNLTDIWLGNNTISDISPVAELTNLTTLDLGNNTISDISPVVGLTNLEVLRLAGNPIQDTTPLCGLQNQNPALDLNIEITCTLLTVREDVNRDGVVDVQDIVYVTQRYGQTGQNRADVNGDGTVNIDDIVLVAAVVDSAPAAPSIRSQLPKDLTAATVNQWLIEAKLTGNKTPTYQRGILVLEQLLAALTPKETALLANYPNPFNPETWIPYRLAEDADVTLTIYDTQGVVVRQLALGHRQAGYYTDRSRAAYWDGRNAVGEQVASGVYFYHLSAGDYSQMRKMVILK